MAFIHRLIRRAAWRWPRLAQALWLWEYAGCRAFLVVELTQAAAARLDHAAILGLGHDRDALELAYSLHCGCLDGADCELAARLDALRQDGVAPVVAEAVRRRRRIVATGGQEHLFDRYGYAPGVYEFDEESERAVLAALQAWPYAEPVVPEAPGDDRGGHGGDGRHQRRADQDVVAPAHPTSSLSPRAEHSAAAPRA